MKTSWRRHRPHAVANLAFRVMSAAGFLAGLVVAVALEVTPPAACNIEQGDCLARIIRHEAVVHVTPPIAGLLVGMLLGTWLARAVHRGFARARFR